MNVDSPGRVARKRTVVVPRKVRSEGAPLPSVRSSATSYDSTLSSSARARASARVRFGTDTERGPPRDHGKRTSRQGAGRGPGNENECPTCAPGALACGGGLLRQRRRRFERRARRLEFDV